MQGGEISRTKFADQFKCDAAAQVEDRGWPVREVTRRLGGSTQSIYRRQKLFS